MANEYTPERRAAIKLLRAGLASYQEIAELARTSRQLVRWWAKMEDIDATQARAEFLARVWQKAFKR